MSNANKICTCTACGSIHQCTPWSDFYTIPDDADALLCEGCFAAHIAMPMRAIYVDAHALTPPTTGGTP